MQKIHWLLLIILWVVPLATFSQQVNFASYNGWEPMLQKARKENKKVFVYFHASWCVPCKTIEKTIFTDSLVYNLLNREAVNIAIDIDDPEVLEIVKKYRIISVPAIVILNYEGNLLEKDNTLPAGKPAAFYELLKIDLDKKEVLPGVSNKLDLNYPAFYNEYFAGNRKTAPGEELVNQYLQNHPDLFSEVNWSVRSVFANNAEGIDVLLRNYDRLAHLYGKEVNAMVVTNYSKALRYLVQEKDSAAFSRLLQVYVSTMTDDNKITAHYFQWTQFLGRSGMDWPRFQKLVMEYNQLYGKKYNNSFCQVMYRNCQDTQVCAYMSSLMNEIVASKATADACIIYATLLLKSNQKQLADTWFSKALELSGDTEKRDRYVKQIEAIKAQTMK
jgi:thiol-disulfide isomerase/thioredoxin